MTTRTDTHMTPTTRVPKGIVEESPQTGANTDSGERGPAPGTMLMIPEPENLDLDLLATLTSEACAQAEQCEDVEQIDDVRAHIAAIGNYLSRRHADHARALAVTERTLEVRIGVLLGPAQVGGDRRSDQVGRDQPDPLTKHQRHDFRKMAQHKDNPEVADAINAGASRAKILRLIDTITAEHPVETNHPKATTPVATSPSIVDAGVPPNQQIIDTTAVDHPGPVVTLTDPGPQAEEPPGLTRPHDSTAIITQVAHTLQRAADDLHHAKPKQVTPDTLRPLAESMTTSLRRLYRSLSYIKDWIE